eukprot:8753063-Pyramimonas_sp.AAC.1
MPGAVLRQDAHEQNRFRCQTRHGVPEHCAVEVGPQAEFQRQVYVGPLEVARDRRPWVALLPVQRHLGRPHHTATAASTHARPKPTRT